MQDLFAYIPPSFSPSYPPQTGAERAPASGRCRTASSALQALLLLSPAGADSKHAGPLGVLLGWVNRDRMVPN